MDLVYMGNIMAREVWGMNIDSMVQNNQCGANTAETTQKMKSGMFDLVCWQHNNKPLVFAAWSDNSVIKML
jgi:hypothetical protein